MVKGTPEVSSGEAVVAVLDDFLTWCKENRALRTAERYEDFIQDFVKERPDEGSLRFGEINVSTLTSKHVTQWLGLRAWNPTTKRNAITALQRGFNWAVKNRGLLRNPIKSMEKPEATGPFPISSSFDRKEAGL